MDGAKTTTEQPNKADRLKKYRWPKGVSGNPNGRPISPIKRIKEMFKENPDQFDEWLEEYLEDKQNRKHVVEMLDGKPKQVNTNKVEGDLTIRWDNGNNDTVQSEGVD